MWFIEVHVSRNWKESDLTVFFWFDPPSGGRVQAQTRKEEHDFVVRNSSRELSICVVPILGLADER